MPTTHQVQSYFLLSCWVSAHMRYRVSCGLARSLLFASPVFLLQYLTNLTPESSNVLGNDSFFGLWSSFVFWTVFVHQFRSANSDRMCPGLQVTAHPEIQICWFNGRKRVNGSSGCIFCATNLVLRWLLDIGKLVLVS